MAFFKNFQTNLPSVNISSILDSVSSRVDELANSVSDATYAVSDQLTEGVTTIVKKVQDTEEGDNVSVAAAQDGGGGGHSSESKPRSKSIWQIARDNEPETAATDSGENTESGASQLEWEWRDGCWRVKLTAAELAEEERKKQERKEMDEQRRRERQAKRTEAQRKRQEQGRVSGRESENEAEPVEEGKKSAVKEEEEEEEVNEDEEEEEEEVAKTKRMKKKSDRKKKEDVKKEKTEEREKSKKKRKSKKKKGKEEAPSDSEEGEKEEERGPEPMAQQRASAWGSKEGSSSEASSERATIQRIHKDASLNELQPPPYPREEQRKTSASSQRSSRGRRPSHRSSAPAGSHPASEEDQEEQEEEEEEADSESYLNKACDEDIPSDSTAVLGQEDVPPLPAAYEPEPMAKYGTLDLAFEYDSGEQLLAVTVTAATDIPALKQTGNISWQVHMVLLPTKKQRAKTGVQKGPCPVFTETFKFLRVEQDSLGDYAVRFRLYSIRRMKKEKVLGEKVFQLTKLNLHGKMALPVTLEPGSEATGCGSVVSVSRSGGALSYRSTEDSLPELLLGLVYNSTTGRLSAEVIQGSHFKTSATEKPIDGLFCCVKHFVGGQLYIMRDTYVKLVMLDSKGKQMSKCRTGVCRGQPSPTYRESFVFQVSLFQLSEVSLVLSVFWRRSSLRPRERLGGVCLGLNSTSEEQSSHWNQMREAEGQQVCHWHTLTDT